MTYVKPTWSLALPRPQFKQFKQISSLSPWFEIYQLPQQVWAILEPHHFQEVMSFLILGKNSAVLLDTGMGIFNLKAEVENLTDLPITVINSHSHFDHIGDNWRFNEVHCLNQADALRALTIGYTMDPADQNLQPAAFDYQQELPNLAQYRFRPAQKVVPFETGVVFDLGNRQLEVIATPGHSVDSVVLADHQRRILFMGDTFYPASLYAYFMPGDDHQNLQIYRDTMAKLADQFSDYQLYCSHNEPLVPGSRLKDVVVAFDAILAGTVAGQSIVEGLRFYQFDGFGIETRI